MTTFDPVAYKNTTREQWQAAAEAWHSWGPTLEQWLGPATEVMLDMCRVSAGQRVLDIAAAQGGQTLAAARRVGPRGFVLATDISSNILEFAKAEARRAGLTNVETRTLDGENLDVPAGTFDAAISRVGLIFFPDQQGALAGIRRALKPGGGPGGGGRLGAIVYSTPERNGFFSTPISIIRARAALPPPAPGQPGPFSLGKPGVIEDAFAKAGFTGIETRVVPAPLRMKSAAECVRLQRHQMMAKLSEDEREATWREIEGEMKKFEKGAGFEGPCEMIVAAGMA